MDDLFDLLAQVDGFDWDEHNAWKIRKQHDVQPQECEEVFWIAPRLAADSPHSLAEPRFVALGATRTGRRPAGVFTLRGSRIRVVTARDQSRKERRELDHAEEAQADPPLR